MYLHSKPNVDPPTLQFRARVSDISISLAHESVRNFPIPRSRNIASCNDGSVTGHQRAIHVVHARKTLFFHRDTRRWSNGKPSRYSSRGTLHYQSSPNKDVYPTHLTWPDLLCHGYMVDQYIGGMSYHVPTMIADTPPNNEHG